MYAGSKPKIERGLNVVVCRLGNDDYEVLPMGTGPNGVGVSTIEMGESIFNIALSHLAHRLHQHS